MIDAHAVLIDIDGVLTVSWEPLTGAVEAVRAIRDAGLPFALITNTTSRTRARIAATLAEAGFPVETEDVLTAPSAAAAYLREHRPDARCLLLNSGEIAEDLGGVHLVDDAPDVVLTGGAGPEFGYEALNSVFGHLQRGAELMAMHANLFWRTSAGLSLDTGAFLLGLQQAAGTRATILGKPARAFFDTALRGLDATAGHTAMIGDDVESDVLGAQRHGLTGVLVRTGKFQPDHEDGIDGEVPDHVIDSVADLPGLLGLG
jgi:HAD superfamily hydrolase (TIGR01458 family)